MTGVSHIGRFDRTRSVLPGYMADGQKRMAEHAEMQMQGPPNTLPMMMGRGPYGNLEMGGMFTVFKVRDAVTSYEDPGWYRPTVGTVAWKI